MNEPHQRTPQRPARPACPAAQAARRDRRQGRMKAIPVPYFFIISSIASPAAWPMRVYQIALPR